MRSPIEQLSTAYRQDYRYMRTSAEKCTRNSQYSTGDGSLKQSTSQVPHPDPSPSSPSPLPQTLTLPLSQHAHTEATHCKTTTISLEKRPSTNSVVVLNMNDRILLHILDTLQSSQSTLPPFET
jgi:hypothetical protein